MKKILISIGCFLLACVFVLFIANFTSEKDTDNIAVDPNTDIKKIDTYYIVKDYNGNIAVFESDKDAPFRITEVRVSELPSADKALLEKGIQASTQEELNRILEDYCS